MTSRDTTATEVLYGNICHGAEQLFCCKFKRIAIFGGCFFPLCFLFLVPSFSSFPCFFASPLFPAFFFSAFPCFFASLLFRVFLLFCFFASLLFCFSASFIFCFSAVLFLCLSAFPCFSAFRASLLLCFLLFPAFLLKGFLCFSLLFVCFRIVNQPLRNINSYINHFKKKQNKQNIFKATVSKP